MEYLILSFFKKIHYVILKIIHEINILVNYIITQISLAEIVKFPSLTIIPQLIFDYP